MKSLKRPTERIQKKLLVLQKGQCAMCGENLNYIKENSKPIFIGQLAHICAVSPNGPRFKPNLSLPEVNSITNLLFLCPSCHKLIDDNDEKKNYSEAYLKNLNTEILNYNFNSNP